MQDPEWMSGPDFCDLEEYNKGECEACYYQEDCEIYQEYVITEEED